MKEIIAKNGDIDPADPDYQFGTVGRYGIELETVVTNSTEPADVAFARQRLRNEFEWAWNPYGWGTDIEEGSGRFFGGIMFMGINDPLLIPGRRKLLAELLVDRDTAFLEFLEAARKKAEANEKK